MRIFTYWQLSTKLGNFFKKLIERRQLITVGLTEQAVSDRIHNLVWEMFGTKKHWYRWIVRTGAHSMLSFKEHPPNLEDLLSLNG